MRTNTTACMRCDQFAKYRLSLSPKRLVVGSAIEVCGRHLVWAVEFVGVAGGKPVSVLILP